MRCSEVPELDGCDPLDGQATGYDLGDSQFLSIEVVSPEKRIER